MTFSPQYYSYLKQNKNEVLPFAGACLQAILANAKLSSLGQNKGLLLFFCGYSPSYASLNSQMFITTFY